LLLLLLALLSGCASDEERIAGYLDDAAVAREAGDHATEILELRNALQLDPTNAEINLLIADASRALGKLPNAAFYYSEAHRLDPTDSRAAMMYASMISTEEPEKAAQIIAETLEREPDNILAHVRKTELALMQGEIEDGLAAALTGVNAAPEAPAAHRNLGTAYRAVIRARLVKKEEVPDELRQNALDAFSRAVELEEEQGEQVYWFDVLERANVYQQWPGHEEEAMAELERAWALAQEAEATKGMLSVTDSALYYARTSGDLGLREWALERRTEVIPANTQAWARLARFKALAPANTDDADENEVLAAAQRAAEVWKQAAERNADDPTFQAQYALAIHRAGRSEEALELLDSAPPAIRSDPAIHMARVRMMVELHRIDDTRAAIDAFAAQHPDDPGVEIARARLDLLAGRDHAAQHRLHTLAGKTERADLYVLLAEAEEKIDDPSAGLAAIERAIELTSSPTPQMLLTRQRLLVQIEDWRGVLAAVQQMQRRGMPIGATARAYRARALYETGRTQQAREELERLVESFPLSFHVVDTFALYEGQKQPDRARMLLDGAIAAHPEAAILILRRAELELGQGKTDAALAILDKYLAIARAESGDRPKLRMARARLLLGLGRTEEALADLKAAFEGRPRPTLAPVLLARVLRSEGRDDEAIEYLERARSTPPVASSALWLLGSLRLSQGDPPAAREVLEEAVRGAPHFARAKNDLAWVLAQMGEDLDRALDLAREARADMPDSPEAADTLGWVYLRRKLPSAALAEFDAAIELATSSDAPQADFHYHRGLALESLDRPRDAAEAFERALALDPAHAGAKDAIARVAGAEAPARQG
jgi:tetratricopeptide (TPR) repeat protein